MVETTWSDLEVASKSTVMEAARQFAEEFTNTAQYQAFEQAYIQYRQDADAQSAIREFQQKQSSLKALQLLNALSEEDRTELQRLQGRFYNQLSVVQYNQAQAELVAISQEIGDFLTKVIGLDFGNSCRQSGGCCG